MTPQKAVYKVILLPLCKHVHHDLFINMHAWSGNVIISNYLEVYCTMIGNSMEIGIAMKILLHNWSEMVSHVSPKWKG